jgi:hypothetical protein
MIKSMELVKVNAALLKFLGAFYEFLNKLSQLQTV